jgi:hypothetical protein
MSEDDLDQLLSNMEASVEAPSESAQPQDTPIINRPKLKKIKRPKVRPMPITDSKEEQIVNADNTTSSSVEFDKTTPYEGDRLADNNNASTAVITSSVAQDLINNDTQYDLDSLPPDLDYFDGVTNDGIYIDTANYTKKSFAYMAAVLCLFVGLYIGKALFSSETVENYGLEGVVTNPDVPAGRPRCGLTERSQACVFYLMNWYKQELNGRDFYRLAAELTGREEYMIETDNLRYANTKIKPGNIAQLNIPALK